MRKVGYQYLGLGCHALQTKRQKLLKKNMVSFQASSMNRKNIPYAFYLSVHRNIPYAFYLSVHRNIPYAGLGCFVSVKGIGRTGKEEGWHSRQERDIGLKFKKT